MFSNVTGNTFSGLVLAGGTSTRMGQDKATLTYKGKLWLDNAVNLLTQAGATPCWVNTHLDTPHKKVTEPFPDQGPLSGIYAGLVATSQPVLIIPVDMPTLSAEQLQALVNAGTDNECVYFEGAPLPCYLKNTPQQRETIKNIVLDDHARKSLYSAWRQFSAIQIATSLPLDNFNTPEDVTDLGETGTMTLSKQ